MNNQSNTPGPWDFIEQGEPNEYLLTRGVVSSGTKPKNIKWLASVRQNGELHTNEQLSNIRLLTAAPEMLDALININGWLSDLFTTYWQTQQTTKREQFVKDWDMVKEAIKKATEL